MHSTQTNSEKIISSVIAASLTYLEQQALRDLFKRVEWLEKSNKNGVLIEAGCALGGSAIVMAAAKSAKRPFYIYDVFEMIPPPSDRDGVDVHQRYEIIKSGRSTGINGNKYYGYEENLFDTVSRNFSNHDLPPQENNIHLVRGLFQDTVQPREQVALAHIDGDWYDSVITCLQRIEPKLILEGILVIDDYFSWSGCGDAVNDYFRDKHERFKFTKHSRLHIQRVE